MCINIERLCALREYEGSYLPREEIDSHFASASSRSRSRTPTSTTCLFSVLSKMYYNEARDDFVRGKRATRFNFGTIFKIAWSGAVAPINAESGFLPVGFYPFDANVVRGNEFLSRLLPRQRSKAIPYA